jgi:hypothetical protein
MSYDLYFCLRSPDVRFRPEDFVAYFQARAHYEVNGSQAMYSNDDTGVYFIFDYMEEDELADAADNVGNAQFPVMFNLNYFRPHPFGLEAQPEVAALVEQFDLTVSDPQASGMGDGEYSSEGFLRGWNAGNAFGCRAILSQDPKRQLPNLPFERLEAVWRWNLQRESRQNDVGQNVFVPRVSFFEMHGEISTGVVWTDGIPILLPTVDLMLVPRQRLAPRRWFRRKDDVVVLTWQQLESIAQRFRKSAGPLDSYEVFYDETPDDIVQVICEKPHFAALPNNVPFDQVLDRELIDQVREQVTGK